MKYLEKNLDENYTRIPHAVLNKYWNQHPTKQQLCGHSSPITQAIQVRQVSHAGEVRTNLSEMVSNTWTHQCSLTSKDLFISSVWTLDAVKRTSQEQQLIEMDFKRERERVKRISTVSMP